MVSEQLAQTLAIEYAKIKLAKIVEQTDDNIGTEDELRDFYKYYHFAYENYIADSDLTDIG